jgi:hypothetical protein
MYNVWLTRQQSAIIARTACSAIFPFPPVYTQKP